MRRCIMQYSIIVPMYNEEPVIAETYRRIKGVMELTGESYEVIFVDDGSKDKTALLIKDISLQDRNVRLVSFSRNFGHQVAITAGMDHATGNAVVVIDADLQDPPEIMLAMFEKWKEGYDVVYARRVKRKGESLFKRITARIFYRSLNAMTDVEIPVDVGDFRLIDRKVCDALKRLPERNRYVRGLVSWLGYRQIQVDFIREERYAGETKYPLSRMLKFALDAITSFSYKPLKLASIAGSVLSMLSFAYLVFVILQQLLVSSAVIGWSSLIAVSLFFNGVTLIMLGIIGEYIGRIYDEAKGRPIYIVSETVGFDRQD